MVAPLRAPPSRPLDLAQSMAGEGDCVKSDGNERAGRVVQIARYQADILRSPETESVLQGKEAEGEFVRESETEERIDDQFPCYIVSRPQHWRLVAMYLRCNSCVLHSY